MRAALLGSRHGWSMRRTELAQPGQHFRGAQRDGGDGVGVVEKAIYNSDLGLTPNTAGTVIRIVMPPLTEERRRDLVKVVKSETEQARIAIRNIRRDSNQDIKELAKERLVNEDEEKRLEQEIQKLTDHYVSMADSLMSVKERELLSV